MQIRTQFVFLILESWFPFPPLVSPRFGFERVSGTGKCPICAIFAHFDMSARVLLLQMISTKPSVSTTCGIANDPQFDVCAK